MSKLIMKNIYLDETEWQELGEKVGKRNRSQWIRDAIHEEVKIADDTEILQEQALQTEQLLGKIKGKLEELTKEKQEMLRQMGDEDERLMTALEEAETLANKHKQKIRKGEKPKGVIGLDEIKEIAERFEIDKNELKEMILINLDVDIPKTGKIQLKETKQSVYSIR